MRRWRRCRNRIESFLRRSTKGRKRKPLNKAGCLVRQAPPVAPRAGRAREGAKVLLLIERRRRRRRRSPSLRPSSKPNSFFSPFVHSSSSAPLRHAVMQCPTFDKFHSVHSPDDDDVDENCTGFRCCCSSSSRATTSSRPSPEIAKFVERVKRSGSSRQSENAREGD